ncbi:MAG TPA: hypothetical protein EYG11_18835, partial [Candidatus Latescibacteria bacterium]|nr:hypothetical protein [Candidatus Latescibacterota bacterium]
MKKPGRIREPEANIRKYTAESGPALPAADPDTGDGDSDDERDNTTDNQGIADDIGAGLDADGDVFLLGFDFLVTDKAGRLD